MLHVLGEGFPRHVLNKQIENEIAAIGVRKFCAGNALNLHWSRPRGFFAVEHLHQIRQGQTRIVNLPVMGAYSGSVVHEFPNRDFFLRCERAVRNLPSLQILIYVSVQINSSLFYKLQHTQGCNWLRDGSCSEECLR